MSKQLLQRVVHGILRRLPVHCDCECNEIEPAVIRHVTGMEFFGRHAFSLALTVKTREQRFFVHDLESENTLTLLPNFLINLNIF